MSIATIKAAIKTNLDALITDGVLGGATSSNIKQDPLNNDIGTYPHAFLMPPGIESEVFENVSVIRTHTFDVMVLFQAEDVSTTADLETKIESMLTKFDEDPTLQGTADGGVLPVSSSPEPFQHRGKDMIMVVLQIQAKEHVRLTYS